jgi:hypothetical protein
MTKMTKRQQLVRKAANHKSTHVRRFAPIIDIVLDGLDRHDISWAGHKINQIKIGNYIGKYQHPTRQPRAGGRLEICERLRNRRLMLSINTMDDAIAFRANPPHFLSA